LDQALQAAVGMLTSGVVAGFAALAVLLLLRYALPPRKLSACSFVSAFVVASGLGHAFAAGRLFSVTPDRNWHWLFYLIPLAGIAGCISTHPRASWFNRCFLVAVLALLTAGLLTSLPVIWAPRPALIVSIFVYLVLSWLIIEPLAARIRLESSAGAFWISATGLSGLIADQISVTEGAIVASIAGALASLAIVAVLQKRGEPLPSLALPILVALGGWACKETISEARLWPLLMIPLAPAALWLTQIGPLARRSRPAAWSTSIAILLAVIAVAAAIVRASGGEYY
jgi:hypothetical protein